ncbi:hypothetical protein ACIBJE_02090 [Micromonospora sp. NPDC050187]|uniref:hypothetical protein n=1 Tax=Micromonospora sp. NPDC050187 TaxID=3364277 RepID=UPI0037A780AB
MARKLSTFVHVHERGEDGNPTGRTEVFGPNDDLPDWAVRSINNPNVWADSQDAAQADANPGGSGGQDGPPPKGGAGSGAPAWREYAARNGVEVPADASREDIIAALDEAKVRTE